MIPNLDDEQILEYLMTSDFIETYSPEEYKFLLSKFRYFYRILHGNFSLYKTEKEGEIHLLKSSIESQNKLIFSEQVKSAELQNQIDFSKKERKLTLKERLTGKIKQF